MLKRLGNGNYEISESDLKKYLRGYFKNEARENGGVDNWSHDDDAMEEYLNEGYSSDKSFEDIYDLVDDFVENNAE